MTAKTARSDGRAFAIGGRMVGPGHPAYIVAELSANHAGDLDRALEIVRLAAETGVDAIKLQTYTADTLTIDCDGPHFRIEGGLWHGRTLYDLYQEAHTPWEWHEALFDEARRCGLRCFSTPFDASAVRFLEQFDPPVYKLASFEILDLELITAIAETGRPVIMSTGMSNLSEIAEAIHTFRAHGTRDLAVLRCVSSYPADPADFDLATIPNIAETFDVVSGLSDHSMGHTVALTAVALGAHVIEKHFIARRADGGPDSAFSMEPAEMKALVEAVRQAEAAIGRVRYGAGLAESGNVVFRRSIFAVADIAAGEPFTRENTRVIRPGHGLPPRDLPQVLGRRAARDIARGTPLRWPLVGGP
ncbi:MAG: pseudaminic acid synthase [Deltaproteobacteria bacterium]|nr:pseudaminic acid synthase [Deltaproteobacteria bacterium]MCB9785478.1 pseudaminic acid synthase [Deltaproteobacteria bacterium]